MDHRKESMEPEKKRLLHLERKAQKLVHSLTWGNKEKEEIERDAEGHYLKEDRKISLFWVSSYKFSSKKQWGLPQGSRLRYLIGQMEDPLTH